MKQGEELGWDILHTESSLWKGEKSRSSDRKSVGGLKLSAVMVKGEQLYLVCAAPWGKYIGKRTESN